ncbi:MAG: hypothetical protein Q8P41_02870 [Pseudomonadota bacterium]|nr:hypothetical protein [Pseudomonadota bacterium]
MLLTLLLACTGAPPLDTAEPEVEDEVPTGTACEALEIRVNGDDPPQVGDEWTVFLWCDDALMTGATRLLFDPNDIAAVSDNTAQFLYAGSATLTMQVGSRRQEREVTITE